jgi:hypothetical protein
MELVLFLLMDLLKLPWLLGPPSMTDPKEVSSFDLYVTFDWIYRCM